ncbi:MAG: hypothetical protein AAGA54_23165 [Myxococcota bacterium]
MKITLLSVLLSLLSPTAQTEQTEPAAAASEASGITVRYRSTTGRAVAAALPEIFSENLSALDRKRLGRKVFSESRVQIARGSFPDGAGLVVIVNVNLRSKDPEGPTKFIGGMLTMKDDATLGAIAVPLRMREARFELEAVTDVDGDGTDEIVYVTQTQTDSTRNRIRWTDGGPKSGVLPPSDG